MRRGLGHPQKDPLPQGLELNRGTHQGYLPEGAQDCRGQTAHGRESGELALRENVLVTLKVLLIEQDPAGEGEGWGT